VLRLAIAPAGRAATLEQGATGKPAVRRADGLEGSFPFILQPAQPSR